MGKKSPKKGRKNPDSKETGKTLGALLKTGEDPRSILKKLRRNDQYQSVIGTKRFLEASFPELKIDFHELKGFTEVFRKKYLSLLKQGFLEEARELWQVLGEGMYMSNEIKEALGYCIENNEKVFCDIISDRVSEGVDIEQITKEAAAHQTRKLISRVLSLLNDCGISVSLDMVRLAVTKAAMDWEESGKDKNKQ